MQQCLLARYASNAATDLPEGLAMARRTGTASDTGIVLLTGLDAHDLPDGLRTALASAATPVAAITTVQAEEDLASWAAQRGISACPYDERLYRLAMQAAADRGATGEVRSLLTTLRNVLDADIEPDDRIEPETLAAFEQALHAGFRQIAI